MSWLVASGGAGGILVLLTAVVVIGRAIFRQVEATEENTAAVKTLTEQLSELKNSYQDLHVRVTVLEDRIKR